MSPRIKWEELPPYLAGMEGAGNRQVEGPCHLSYTTPVLRADSCEPILGSNVGPKTPSLDLKVVQWNGKVKMRINSHRRETLVLNSCAYLSSFHPITLLLIEITRKGHGCPPVLLPTNFSVIF